MAITAKIRERNKDTFMTRYEAKNYKRGDGIKRLLDGASLQAADHPRPALEAVTANRTKRGA